MSGVHPYTVEDIKVFTRRGPWQTKSGGELSVLFAMGAAEVNAFLDQDNPEFHKIASETGLDIRGFRSYEVTGIEAGNIGALEWHPVRTEFIRAVSGKALWVCLDRNGDTKEFKLDGETAVMIPPQIFHVYKALEPARLQVLCNTIFDPEDPRTHDTFFADTFSQQAVELAAQYK